MLEKWEYIYRLISSPRDKDSDERSRALLCLKVKAVFLVEIIPDLIL